MKFISLFSGIGGMDVALERAGMTCQRQVEIDELCRSVLKKHWPHVTRANDVTKEKEESTDLVCGGFPCQDLSTSGKRTGLAGARSGLFFEFARIIAASSPTWILVENVAGLLSSNNGRDMGIVLSTLGQLGYGWAYRLLDSRYWNVPQKRRRVYIVGCHQDTVSAVKVLFDSETESGSHQESPQETRQMGHKETAPVVCIDGQNVREMNVCGPLITMDPVFKSCGYGVIVNGVTRRLTPTECLRLQGFSDDWLSSLSLTDSQKYHMIGNSVAVPVLEWIGKRMLHVYKKRRIERSLR